MLSELEQTLQKETTKTVDNPKQAIDNSNKFSKEEKEDMKSQFHHLDIWD